MAQNDFNCHVHGQCCRHKKHVLDYGIQYLAYRRCQPDEADHPCACRNIRDCIYIEVYILDALVSISDFPFEGRTWTQGMLGLLSLS